MFVHSSTYLQALNDLLGTPDEVCAAVAFWGAGAESLVANDARKVKIVCNLRSGATNPQTVEILRATSHIELRQHDSLHAKVVFTRAAAIVGSANMSGNGLNLEGSELQGWEEAGISTSDAAELREIRTWFEHIWAGSRDITDTDIEKARITWNERRSSRIRRTGRGGQPVFSRAEDFEDRPVFLAIYRAGLSKEAQLAFETVKQTATAQLSIRSTQLATYEDWPTLPYKAALIDLYYGPRGSLTCHGIYRRVFDETFRRDDGSEGELEVCVQENSLLDRPVSSQQLKELTQMLRPAVERIWQAAGGDDTARVISLFEALNIAAAPGGTTA